jgi:hypothetical protein
MESRRTGRTNPKRDGTVRVERRTVIGGRTDICTVLPGQNTCKECETM